MGPALGQNGVCLWVLNAFLADEEASESENCGPCPKMVGCLLVSLEVSTKQGSAIFEHSQASLFGRCGNHTPPLVPTFVWIAHFCQGSRKAVLVSGGVPAKPETKSSSQ